MWKKPTCLPHISSRSVQRGIPWIQFGITRVASACTNSWRSNQLPGHRRLPSMDHSSSTNSPLGLTRSVLFDRIYPHHHGDEYTSNGPHLTNFLSTSLLSAVK